MILLAACIVLSARKKKKDIIFISTVAGLLLEITFLEFNGRVMARLVDLMILAMAVARATPKSPNFGAPKSPKIKVAFKMMFKPKAKKVMQVTVFTCSRLFNKA